MDTNLHILTTNEHVLKPIVPGKYHAGEKCVTLSKWGISNIGTIQPGFHVAYLPLSDIQQRSMDSAPTGAKLLLYSRYGCWLIGTINQENRKHYDAWAPLPKVAAEVNRRAAVPEESHPVVQDGVRIFARMVELAHTPEEKMQARQRLSLVRGLLVDAVTREPGELVSFKALCQLIARPGEDQTGQLNRLTEVLPYLTGARGPYDICFFDGQDEVEVHREADGFYATSRAGQTLTEADIGVMCRRNQR